MIWKRKLIALIICLVFSSIATAVVFHLPAVYRAETLLLVEGQTIPEKLVSSTVNMDLQDRLATISQQILSTTRLQKIIEKFNLYQKERANGHPQEEIIEMMRADTQIVPERGYSHSRSGAIRLSYKGPNPPVVAAVTNELGNLFIEENLKARETEAEGTSEFIQSQLAEAKKSLQQQEAKLSAFKQKYTGELPGQEQTILSSLSQSQFQLQSRDEAIAHAQQTKALLEASLPGAQTALEIAMTPDEPQSPSRFGGSSGATASAPPKKVSELLQERLDALRLKYTDSYPDIRHLREEIARVREQEAKTDRQDASARNDAAQKAASQIADAEHSGSKPPPAMPVRQAQAISAARERLDTLKKQITYADQEIKMRLKERQELAGQVNSQQSRLEHLPAREQELIGLMRDYDLSKAQYQSLYDKNITADLSAEMERRQKAERFAVLDVARVPEVPYSPNRPLLIGIAVFLGMILGLLAGFGLELRENVVLGEWELPPDVAVLGRVPMIEAA